MLTSACRVEKARITNRSVLSASFRCSDLNVGPIRPTFRNISRSYRLTYEERIDDLGGRTFVINMTDLSSRYVIDGISDYVSIGVFVARGGRATGLNHSIFDRAKTVFASCRQLR